MTDFSSSKPPSHAHAARPANDKIVQGPSDTAWYSLGTPMDQLKLEPSSICRTSAGEKRVVCFAKSTLVALFAIAVGSATACGSDADKGDHSPGAAGEASGGSDGRGANSSTVDGGEGTSESGGAPGLTQGGAPGASDGGQAAGGAGEVGGIMVPTDGTTTTIPPTGGTVTLTNDADQVTTSITVPSGALAESSDVTIDPATLPATAPGSVEAVAPGFTIDFGGAKLTVPAKAKLRLPLAPDQGDLVILVVTDSGTGFVTYTIETEGEATYAVFDVAEGGRYLPVRLKSEPGCDETLPAAPTIATQADVDKLSKVRRIVGDLRISGASITSLASLKCLLQLDGALIIDRTSVTSLKGLDKLTFVGANGNYYYGGYGVQLTNNSLLDSALLPSVLAVGTRQNYYYQSLFQVQGNPVLAAFGADAIESAGLVFSTNGAASTETSISMAALTRAQSLSIQQNPSLKNVDGLAALERIVGDFNVTNNGLINLDGLESLSSAGGLTLSGNVALTSAAGLSKLKTVGSVNITNNQLLKSVDLAELSEATSAISTASISVTQNAALTEFKADKLTALAGALTFQNNGNATVNTVMSFATLASVAGATSITDNLGLQSLDGLQALATAADLTLQRNASLKTTAGLAALTSVGNLNISSNAKLTDIEGLTKLARIDHALTISQNTLLKTASLPAVATMGGQISVSSNAALTSFAADALRVAPAAITFQSNGTAGVPTQLSFAALTSVAGALQVSSNPGLAALDGFGALLSVGADLNISSNAALTSLSSLTKLSTITGGLTLSQDNALTSLTGLGALSRVTQGVSITNNGVLADVTLPALASAAGVSISTNAALATIKLDALTASSGALTLSSNGTAVAVTTTTVSFAVLTTVASFQISSNPKLKLLTGFPVLGGVSGSFQVISNVLLPNCVVVGLRNQIQQNGAISGTIYISGNLVDGCATT